MFVMPLLLPCCYLGVVLSWSSCGPIVVLSLWACCGPFVDNVMVPFWSSCCSVLLRILLWSCCDSNCGPVVLAKVVVLGDSCSGPDVVSLLFCPVVEHLEGLFCFFFGFQFRFLFSVLLRFQCYCCGIDVVFRCCPCYGP